MMQDMEGIEQYEQQIDYFSALKTVEERVAKMGPSQAMPAPPKGSDVEEGLEEDYLMENIVTMEAASKNEGGGYIDEYQDIIS